MKPTFCSTPEAQKEKSFLSKMPWSQVRLLKLEAFRELTSVVMLRLLEYFTGILILTTNRVKSIDYAMMSRISYAIKFQTLRPENQKLICNNYIAQASQKQGIKAGEKPGLEAVVNRFRPQDNLNGREIRTLFTTAQLLGGGKLTAQNVDDIHEQQQSFIHDMKTEYIKAEHSAVVQ